MLVLWLLGGMRVVCGRSPKWILLSLLSLALLLYPHEPLTYLLTPLPPPQARAPRRRIVVPRPALAKGKAEPDTLQVVDRSDIDPKI